MPGPIEPCRRLHRLLPHRPHLHAPRQSLLVQQTDQGRPHPPGPFDESTVIFCGALIRRLSRLRSLPSLPTGRRHAWSRTRPHNDNLQFTGLSDAVDLLQDADGCAGSSLLESPMGPPNLKVPKYDHFGLRSPLHGHPLDLLLPI